MTPQHSHLLYEFNIYDNFNRNSSVKNDEGDNSNNTNCGTNNKRNTNMIRIIDAVRIELVIRMMRTVIEVVIILMVAK